MNLVQTTRFNPEGKSSLTFGESLGPAMKITEPEDAKQYLAAYVAYIQAQMDSAERPRTDGMTAEQIAKNNLGYYAGYYDHETRIRVERLFECTHPYFGSAAANQMTPEQAFAAGRAAGDIAQWLRTAEPPSPSK